MSQLAKIINPLAFNVPIVDPKTGYPTEYFKRILEDISEARISASLIDALGGDPNADQVVVWDDTAGDLAFAPASDVLDMIGSEAHGDILYRDSAAWALLPAGTDGDVLTTHGASADPTWETPSSGGGTWALAGSGWTATGVWDQAVDGSQTAVSFTGLGTPTDIMIICDSTTRGTSGQDEVRVSVNNGSTYYSTSGDYVFVDTSGVSTSSTGFRLFQTNATAARRSAGIIHAANVATPKIMSAVTRDSPGQMFVFSASTSQINAVQVVPNGGGSLTGGKIYCLTR